jgi:hypothetical protein
MRSDARVTTLEERLDLRRRAQQGTVRIAWPLRRVRGEPPECGRAAE